MLLYQNSKPEDAQRQYPNISLKCNRECDKNINGNFPNTILNIEYIKYMFKETLDRFNPDFIIFLSISFNPAVLQPFNQMSNYEHSSIQKIIHSSTADVFIEIFSIHFMHSMKNNVVLLCPSYYLLLKSLYFTN